jgi:hypothetical protein
MMAPPSLRYVPQVLEGTARIWLNNLPARSISCWIELEEAFNSNFTSTYKRPNRPQQLQACRQRENETDREFLTRWCTLRNTCEGIDENLAIGWFLDSCRHGSMLWQRLQRKRLGTLAETIRIADSYALGDPMQPALADPNFSPGGGSLRQQDPRDLGQKRKEDYRYNSYQVAAVEDQEEPPAPKFQERPKFNSPKEPWNKQAGKKKWSPKKSKRNDSGWTFESMLDQPCSFHTAAAQPPANHTSRQCSWMGRVARGEGMAPRPQTHNPLTGANAQAIPQQARVNHGPQQPARPQPRNAGVNQVQHDYRSLHVYQEHDEVCVVFITEPTDKLSQRWREMEVNTTMPTVPSFMDWSEQEITWSQADHPKIMPKPETYALVLDPSLVGPVKNIKFS